MTVESIQEYFVSVEPKTYVACSRECSSKHEKMHIFQPSRPSCIPRLYMRKIFEAKRR